jgi:hypothetical protein
MLRITVRRHQGNEERSRNDFVVRGEDPKKVERQVRDLLRTAQTQRGTGIWSGADPQVLLGNTLIGQLGSEDDITYLAGLAIAVAGGVSERLSPSLSLRPPAPHLRGKCGAK